MTLSTAHDAYDWRCTLCAVCSLDRSTLESADSAPAFCEHFCRRSGPPQLAVQWSQCEYVFFSLYVVLCLRIMIYVCVFAVILLPSAVSGGAGGFCADCIASSMRFVQCGVCRVGSKVDNQPETADGHAQKYRANIFPHYNWHRRRVFTALRLRWGGHNNDSTCGRFHSDRADCQVNVCCVGDDRRRRRSTRCARQRNRQTPRHMLLLRTLDTAMPTVCRRPEKPYTERPQSMEIYTISDGNNRTMCCVYVCSAFERSSLVASRSVKRYWIDQMARDLWLLPCAYVMCNTPTVIDLPAWRSTTSSVTTRILWTLDAGPAAEYGVFYNVFVVCWVVWLLSTCNVWFVCSVVSILYDRSNYEIIVRTLLERFAWCGYAVDALPIRKNVELDSETQFKLLLFY